jgi:hypothetical protein
VGFIHDVVMFTADPHRISEAEVTQWSSNAKKYKEQWELFAQAEL